MKKKYQILIGLVLFLIGVFSMEYYIQKDHSHFFAETIEQYRNDKSLMVSIGGFKSYSYKFNENQLKEDTLDFRMVIKGKKRDFVVTGEAIKTKDNSWIILEEKTVRTYKE